MSFDICLIHMNIMEYFGEILICIKIDYEFVIEPLDC